MIILFSIIGFFLLAAVAFIGIRKIRQYKSGRYEEPVYQENNNQRESLMTEETGDSRFSYSR